MIPIPCLLVVNEGAADEVSGGDVGHVPQSGSTVLDDVHVVGAACIVFCGRTIWNEKERKTKMVHELLTDRVFEICKLSINIEAISQCSYCSNTQVSNSLTY